MDAQRAGLIYIFPVLIMIALLEALFIILVQRKTYPWRESLTSVGVALGQRFTGLATAGLVAGMFDFVWRFRIWTMDVQQWWGLLLLFLGVECCYYWQHRVMHECRWFWASHAVHHSPQHLNLSGAYRLGWTGSITGASLFYVPLILLGFSPTAIALTLVFNLLYQFWLHTELIPSLAWFDWILNTPSNHRAHHAINPRYLDTNYGGVTMIFDHLFGTYVAESADDPCSYGLVHQIDSYNPFTVVFNEWIQIARDIKHSRSLREVVGYLFSAPGWSPNGDGLTSRRIKAMAKLTNQANGDEPKRSIAHPSNAHQANAPQP